MGQPVHTEQVTLPHAPAVAFAAAQPPHAPAQAVVAFAAARPAQNITPVPPLRAYTRSRTINYLHGQQVADAAAMHAAMQRILARRHLIASMFTLACVNAAVWILWLKFWHAYNHHYPWPMWVSFATVQLAYGHTWRYLVVGCSPAPRRQLANTVAWCVQVNLVCWSVFFMTHYYYTHELDWSSAWPIWVSGATSLWTLTGLSRYYATRTIHEDDLRREMLRGQP